MSRRLVLLNVVLLALTFGAGAYIVRELTAPAPKPAPGRAAAKSEPSPAPASPTSAAAASATRSPAATSSMVASRNLFSPTRNEAPAAATTARAAPPQPKPNLYGVVVREGTPIAYLEDPATKRVAGYRLGDSIAGGTVNAIDADHIVLNRPDGPVDVRLRDPGKPRPAVQPAPPATPGAPAGTPVQPGMAPSTLIPPLPPQPAVQQPGFQPGQVPVQPGVQPRRPLPPNVLRRLAPGSPNDASQP